MRLMQRLFLNTLPGKFIKHYMGFTSNTTKELKRLNNICSLSPHDISLLTQLITGNVQTPHVASFLVNNRCNARCNMCLVSEYFQDQPNELTLENFKTMAENLHLENFESVVLSGAGEPLLNNDLFGILSFIKKNYHIGTLLATNGIALTPDKACELANLKLNGLSVSVNAATRDTYKQIMQVDCFGRVLENIRYYQSQTDNTKQVELSFVAQRKNIDEFPAFIKLAHDLKVQRVIFRYAKLFPKEQRRKQALNKSNYLKDTDSLYYCQEYSDRCFQEAMGLAAKYRIIVEHNNNPLFNEDFQLKRCRLPFNELLVGIDGQVYPCCGAEAILKIKVESGEYDFGNLLTQRLEEFWNNKHWKYIRYMTLFPESKLTPECDTCFEGIGYRGHLEKCHILGKEVDYVLQHSNVEGDRPESCGRYSGEVRGERINPANLQGGLREH